MPCHAHLAYQCPTVQIMWTCSYLVSFRLPQKYICMSFYVYGSKAGSLLLTLIHSW
jgi:predicted FMN-binding regulatory protein PaiB